jgi:ribosomal protein S13
MSVPEAFEKAVEERENKFTAIYISILAVLLAICGIGDDDAAKIAVRANIAATDTYAFFQAKNIRQTVYQLQAEAFETRLTESALAEETRKSLTEKADIYRKRAERYESEPETGEGKKELLAKAKALEAERDLALARDPYFNLGQGTLQIAIVLASVSLIVGGSFLLWVSGALAILGTLATINAFTLLVVVPGMS